MADLPDALRRHTGLTRVVDPTLPSNRFALFIGGVGLLGAFVVGMLADGDAAAALGAGVRTGISAFLAWALARELDPDRRATARYAGFGGLALALVGTPDVAATLALLLAVRIVTRSTGVRPTPPDLAVLVAVAWVAASDPTGVVAGFGLAAALVWDTRLPVRAPSSSGAVGVLVLVATVVSAILGGALLAGWEAPGIVEVAVFLSAIAAATRIGITHVVARTDATDEPLDVERLHRARTLTGAVLAGTIVWVGGPAVGALAAAWAAFTAVGLVAWRAR